MTQVRDVSANYSQIEYTDQKEKIIPVKLSCNKQLEQIRTQKSHPSNEWFLNNYVIEIGISTDLKYVNEIGSLKNTIIAICQVLKPGLNIGLR